MTDHELYDDGCESRGRPWNSMVGTFPMKHPSVVYVNVYCILQRLARLAMYSNRGRKDFPNSLIQQTRPLVTSCNALMTACCWQAAVDLEGVINQPLESCRRRVSTEHQ